MSRIGRMPITVPAGVEVTIGDGNVVTVKGPQGTLTKTMNPAMTITCEDGVVHVTRPDDEKLNRSLHGLTRTLIHNMVIGVTEGYKKELEVNGVGYRVEKKGKQLVMKLGFSHDVTVEEVEGITIEVPEKSTNKIIIHGIDKHSATANSLGLRKIGQKTIQPDNAQTRGKIAQIGYLLKVTEEQ